MKRLTGITMLVILATGCMSGRHTGTLAIEKTIQLDSVPSGSGMIFRGDDIFIVGDDGTAIYKLSGPSLSPTVIPLKGFDHTLYREARTHKHDYEAAALVRWAGKDYLLAFGSGSNNITRDSLLMIAPDDPADQRSFSLKDFYARLLNATGTKSRQWNIEGAAVVGDRLYLCNRGNNLLIELSLTDFLEYILRAGTHFPSIQQYMIRLPAIHGRQARLSGACGWKNDMLLFSASVEDTPDWTTDGPILGSFIIAYSVKDQAVRGAYALKDRKGNYLIEKLESVEVIPAINQPGLHLVAISDNDDGTSKLFRLKINGLD